MTDQIKETAPSRKTKPNTKRIAVELTPQSAAELERLKECTSLNTTDILRYSLVLMQLYVEAAEKGEEFRIVNTNDPQDQSRIRMPFLVGRKLQ